MGWYVLFVKTGFEDKVIKEIDRSWKFGDLTPFIPTYESYPKIAGKRIVEKRSLFPGYIFVETELGTYEFVPAARRLMHQSQYALTILRNGGLDSLSFAMTDEEREAFSRLFNGEYCVERSKGFLEGGRVVIVDGPLCGLDGCIKKINRHRMQATIEIMLMNRPIDVVVGLEVIDKDTPNLSELLSFENNEFFPIGV
jgi:transcriptional antiterminator NusG